ncbi:MAG: hypothetical protein J7J17_02665 [Hadesarchaea archaeon]|nr:hypothetical protein [Hadesarchaea archaeon]
MEEILDAVVVGHVTIDVNSLPWGVMGNMLGGAPTYAGLTLTTLGKRVGIVAKVGSDFPERFSFVYSKLGLDTEGIITGGEETTTFENIYDEKGNREQRCKVLPSKISPDEVPEIYKDARSFYVSPIAGEVTLELLKSLKRKHNLVMLDPQGFFREIDGEGRIQNREPPNLEDLLKNVDIVKIGKEELETLAKAPENLLEELRDMGPRIAIATHGKDGCMVLSDEGLTKVKSLGVAARDPTGAGDVFGAAFLSRYLDTHNAAESAKFASAAAGLKIEYRGPIGFPTEDEVLKAMERLSP